MAGFTLTDDLDFDKSPPPQKSNPKHTSQIGTKPSGNKNIASAYSTDSSHNQVSSSSSIFEVFEINRIEQTCSALCAPEPIGIGTGEIESIFSYFIRIVTICCVSSADLMKYIMRPKLIRLNLGDTWRSMGAMNVTLALEDLTHRLDLTLMTFEFWDNLLRTSSPYKRENKWCPECFEDWRSTGKTLYLPLKWSIPDVKICLKHQRYLSKWCPRCRNDRFSISKYSRIGYCPRCKRWLGTLKSDPPISDSLLDEQAWAQKNIDLLLSIATPIETCVSNKISRISRSRLRRNFGYYHDSDDFSLRKDFVKRYVHKIFDGDVNLFARTFDLSLLDAWCMYLDKKRPRLKELLSLSRYINVPLINFIMDGSVRPTRGQLRYLRRKKLITNTCHQTQPPDMEKLKLQLNEFLSKEVPPYSLHDIAIEIGNSKPFLRKHFPGLMCDLSMKYAAYEKTPFSSEISDMRNQIVYGSILREMENRIPNFHNTVRLFEPSISSSWHIAPVILEWVRIIRKLGYSVQIVTNSDGSYTINYQKRYINRMQHITPQDIDGWVNDTKRIRRSKRPSSGK